MKCKNCSFVINGNNMYYCSFNHNFCMVDGDMKCPFDKYVEKQWKCQDCDRLNNDMACLTCREDDNAKDCGGFIDNKTDEITENLVRISFFSEKMVDDIVKDAKEIVKKIKERDKNEGKSKN